MKSNPYNHIQEFERQIRADERQKVLAEFGLDERRAKNRRRPLSQLQADLIKNTRNH